VWLKSPLVTTSSFSGSGAFEIALDEVRRILASLLSVDAGQLIRYAVWEKDLHARGILLASEEHRPAHLFGDYSGNLLPVDRQRLQMFLDSQLDKLASAKRRLKQNEISRPSYKAMASELSMETLETLRLELGKVEFAAEAYCAIHDGMCPVSPRASPILRDLPWIEGAGTICCPFSSMSSSPNWCGESTLVTLSWAYCNRFHEPDRIIHECVAGFSEYVFKDILGEVRDTLKSVWAKPLHADAAVCYDMRSKVFSPSDLGIPTERRRRYATYELAGPSPLRSVCPSFEDLFFRRLLLDASVYMVAPLDMQLWDLRRRASEGRIATPDSPLVVDVLRRGDCENLEGYQCLADKLELRTIDGLWKPSVAIVNLSQRPEFFKMISTKCVPALLRRSEVYDLVRDRLLTVAELWLVQGFPHPELAKQEDVGWGRFPFQSSLAQSAHGDGQCGMVSLATQKSLIGNSMHIAQVGVWILFSMC
jgi:hypothetical protein